MKNATNEIKASRFVTRDVDGGAYKGRRLDLKATLTHSVGLDDSGRDLFVVCGKVKLDHVGDAWQDDEPRAPTCPHCLAKLAKMGK